MEIQLKKVLAPEDIDKVCSLSKKIWLNHYSSIIGEQQVRYMLETYHSKDSIKQQLKNGYIYYLIEYNQNITGYLNIKYNEKEHTAILDKIYILKEFRKKGIAEASINLLEEAAIKLKIKNIWLQVNKKNTGSIEAYIKMGFCIVKSVKQEIGNNYVTDDYYMEKQI